MTVSARRVTVGTAATQLDSDPEGRLPTRSVLVENVGAEACFLGGPDVTATTGKTLAAGGSISLDVHTGDALFAIVPGPGTVDVEVLQSGYSG